ncbi:hypothetical protein G3545_04445 [Starkeya sp. ORNL1]|nr:hypothetical protein G3545_04445 [Starkeya sp. ORNL1]
MSAEKLPTQRNDRRASLTLGSGEIVKIELSQVTAGGGLQGVGSRRADAPLKAHFRMDFPATYCHH